jgi:RNA polymerase sigma-70 factor (ECF subfamily)
MTLERPDTSGLLRAASQGSAAAFSEAFDRLYSALHSVAAAKIAKEPRRHIDTTELIHEAYFRLSRERAPAWNSRQAFLAAASGVMRRVLIDHARQRLSLKRNAGSTESYDDEVTVPFGGSSCSVIEVSDLLDKLSVQSEQAARVVELRVFGGLSLPEVADELGLSLSTVERRWRMARAWILTQLAPSAEPD